MFLLFFIILKFILKSSNSCQFLRLEALDWQASLKNTICGCGVSELVTCLLTSLSNPMCQSAPVFVLKPGLF